MNFTFNGKPSKTLSLLALSTLAFSTVLLGQVSGSLMLVMAQEVGESVSPSQFWNFNPQSNQLRLTLSPGVAPRYFLLARPMRIAIEFPNTVEVSPQTLNYEGVVEQVMISPQDNGNLRITLQLRSGVELQPKQVALQQIDSQRWLVTPLIADSSSSIDSFAPTSAPIAPARISPNPTGLPVGASSLQPPLSDVTISDVTIPQATLPQGIPSAASLSQSPLNPSPELAPASPSTAVLNQWPTQIVELSPQPLSTQSASPSTLVQTTPAAVTPPVQPVVPPQPAREARPLDTVTTTIAKAPKENAPETNTPEESTILQTRPLTTTAIASVSTPSSAAASAASPSAASPSAASPSAVDSRALPSAIEFPKVSSGEEQPVSTSAQDDRKPVVLPTVPQLAVPQPQSQNRSQVVSQPITPLEFGQVLPIQGSQPTSRSQNLTRIANPSTPDAPTTKTPDPDAATSDTPSVIRPLTAITVAGTTPRATLDPVVPAATIPTAAITATAPVQPQRLNPKILLAKGSPIPLRYTGTVPLRVPTGEERQEVLLVDEDIKSPQGQVIIPGGSEVLGRFETNWRGSRFVAQAISFGPNNQSFEAKSDRLESDRSANPVGIGAGSGSGAIAGTLLGGGFGALGGAAIGAVSGYFMSPQPVTLEPHQILIVYLAEDWLAN